MYSTVPAHLYFIEDAKDTREEALKIVDIVGDKPFYLVTSATHLKRAVALFRKLGARPIPVPAHYYLKSPEFRFSLKAFFPSSHTLEMSQSALHEYMGLLWTKMRGQT